MNKCRECGTRFGSFGSEYCRACKKAIEDPIVKATVEHEEEDLTRRRSAAIKKALSHFFESYKNTS